MYKIQLDIYRNKYPSCSPGNLFWNEWKNHIKDNFLNIMSYKEIMIRNIVKIRILLNYGPKEFQTLA